MNSNNCLVNTRDDAREDNQRIKDLNDIFEGRFEEVKFLLALMLSYMSLCVDDELTEYYREGYIQLLNHCFNLHILNEDELSDDHFLTLGKVEYRKLMFEKFREIYPVLKSACVSGEKFLYLKNYAGACKFSIVWEVSL